MKKLISFISIILFVFFNNSLAQTGEGCGTSPIPNESIDLNQEGGIYLTAQGELKVLVVFVRFRDDHSYHPYWDPNDVGAPPDNYTTFIDPNLKTNSTHFINLTNYFKKMSFNVYKVTGQAIYVETPHDKSWYGSPVPNRYLANKDVLQNVVDPLVNFNDYDKWSTSSNYNHQNVPDGTVDMIVMVWRGLVFANWWSGEASLGYNDPNPPYNNYFYVENGTKLIKTGFGTSAGSGVTVHYWGDRTPERNFKVTVHEISHWLLGGSHPYSSGNDGHSFWGMLTLGGEGICANTYERERVAWINPMPITGDILNAPFQDYIEYGTAYKYHPPNGETNENYYFENHQKLSIYDNGTSSPNDKGIFVFHQRNIYNGTNNIRVKTSNGQWNWENLFNTTCWEVTVPAFKPVTVNRAGFNNRDMIPKNGGGAEWLYALINSSGNAVCGDWKFGGGLDNSFNLTYNNVFSPYSNPYTHTWSNTQNNFTMEVTAQNGSVVNARFYLTNPLDGKPSKPQNPKLSANPGNNLVRLSWEHNLETDKAYYEVSRKVTALGSTWQVIGTTTNNYFVDNEFYYSNPVGDFGCTYRLRVKDTQNKFSVYSDEVFIRAEMMGKKAINIEPVTAYDLDFNYPNPFNPSTQISYSIKENSFVKLKVYDLLGAEVATLVNETKESGYHSVEFNASALPSGVYIYTMQAGSFVSSKKMIFLK